MSQEGKNLSGEEQFNFIYNTNDSGKVRHERKVIRMIPPPPPVPGIHAVRVQGFSVFGGDPFSFNPDDKDIISYDKKDIGKGLGKITLVRKKQVEGVQKKEVEVKVEVNDE